ncbi:hypothetical protein THAOC_23538, partial [Thalassiosira oceanica]
DFAGLWGHEHPQDPHCVRSRTGFLINLSGCPVVWSSKLQSEIALSTMEAEYVALSTACRSLFPVVDLLREIGLCLDLPVDPASRLHIEVHEDNVGALTLGRLEPRRMTPRSKHYAVKYHWFRSQLGPRNVVLTKIASEDQLGDIFTKGLGAVQFKVLRKRIMGCASHPNTHSDPLTRCQAHLVRKTPSDSLTRTIHRAPPDLTPRRAPIALSAEPSVTIFFSVWPAETRARAS